MEPGRPLPPHEADIKLRVEFIESLWHGHSYRWADLTTKLKGIPQSHSTDSANNCVVRLAIASRLRLLLHIKHDIMESI